MGTTVKDAARAFNVSERTIYMARELIGTGRNDLCRKVEEGALSLLAALRKAKPEKYTKKTRLSKFVALWENASITEREDIVLWLSANLQKEGRH